ncbi:APA family basic amino acid/polyamine antiporter [Enterococcus sp. DIV2402]|uniref:APA family basic amino acid/polyamine antiporter n=1 Tax=Candidatus Enterococcus lowellii TaxID=2230877 RepID=A0ABZ2SRT9_9ENTE|nr:amino acid permease [Enterococcus sp. DIV2402]MBO0463024.1 amino acid permease [Enterococcus sp. DIV2402]
MKIFRKKSVNKQVVSYLTKELTLKDLIMLGIGAVIGTGIFVVTGQASANYAGPALSVSFIVAAIVVILSGLCFAEFASRVPISGGPYGYMYVVFGELSAWMAGWFLICEYMLAVSSVASGWSGYLQGFLGSINLSLPKALTASYNPQEGTYIDLIAALVVVFITLWVTQEAKKALRLNNLMVWVKFGIIILFIVVGVFYVDPTNWQPFMPNGMKGIMDGAALVFFAFLGFDAISMAAEEVKNPQKDIPKGIIGAIVIATLLYITVTMILTGIVPFEQLGIGDPVAFAMRYVNQGVVGSIISVGAILTLLTVTISMLYSLARLIYAISKDGLLPSFLQKIDEKRRTPKNATYVAGGIALFFAAAFPLTILAELTNISALACLVMMSLGILRLRKQLGSPKKGEFQVPFVPLLPIISVISCVFLMTRFSAVTWIVFGITIALGLLIYFVYGYQHSHLNKK